MRVALKRAALQLRTAQELATLLGGEASTFKKMAQQGRVEAVKKGKTWLFDPKDFPPYSQEQD